MALTIGSRIGPYEIEGASSAELASAILRDTPPLVTDLRGDSPEPLWGRVVYHLLPDLDAADDWYDRMIEHRDPFALVYASASIVEPLRRHHRWPELAARMKLPATAT